jgi:hypothetical protein
MHKDFSELALPVGYQLQLTMVGQDYKRYRCTGTLIGYQSGGGFMVCLTHKPAQIMLREGLKVEGGVETPLGVGRFVSRIEQVATSPFEYLTLAWPESLSWQLIRQAGRYRVEFPLQIIAQTSLGVAIKPMRGLVLDMSETGARIVVEKALTAMVNQVELSFDLPAMGKLRPILINGVIRQNLSIDPQQYGFAFAYGVEFLELDDLPSLALHVFTLDQQSDVEHCSLSDFN